MAKKPQNYQVSLISEDAQLVDNVTAIFQNSDLFNLSTDSLADRAIQEIVETVKPDVFLLDFSYPVANVLDLIENIVRDYPDRSVIVILAQEDIQKSNNVILAGARAFLVEPFTPEMAINLVTRVCEMNKRLVSASPESRVSDSIPKSVQKGTIAFFSPKGGAGCTTAAINMAIAFHHLAKSNLLLMDGKHQFGHVALSLNLRSANTLVDLMSHSSFLDEGLIKQVTLRHKSGIDVLSAPATIAEAQGIHADALFKVLSAIQANYSYVFIDAGNHLDENAVTYMDAADYVIVILNPDIASMHDLRKFIDLAKNLSYQPGKLQFLLNKTGNRNQIKVAEIEKLLRVELLGSVPAHDNLMAASLNEGTPIIMKKPYHPISRAYKKMAKQLLPLLRNVQLHDTPPTSGIVLDQSSKLG
jgi:pilus assembly protein CpaE